MKESSFQFQTPKLIKLTYNFNNDFSQENFEGIELQFKKLISYDAEENAQAYVSLQVEIGDASSPFTISIIMGALFSWDCQFTKSATDEMLKYNACALLLAYIRPIVSVVSGSSGYPSYNIPFIDFREIKDEEIKEEDEPEL